MLSGGTGECDIAPQAQRYAGVRVRGKHDLRCIATCALGVRGDAQARIEIQHAARAAGGASGQRRSEPFQQQLREGDARRAVGQCLGDA